ncbi:hypothetical protein V2J09_003705 [Rumex salicifolius]
MEIINSKAVKLRSHLDKYLVADDDRVTVRQSRNGENLRSIWLVEASSGGAVRFRNYATGLYIGASDAAFLLGMTGKRVFQSSSVSVGAKASIDWKPEKDGFQMRLKTTTKEEGTFLRANGGTPPWRNSVTHDVPVSGATSNWTLWDLEPVEVPAAAEEDNSAIKLFPPSPRLSAIKSGMDFFNNAKSVRLRSHHGKYLTANKADDSVSQHSSASSGNAQWSVELASGTSFLRLKSCHGKYLTATDHPFLLGMTGCKVIQTLPARLHHDDDGIEWEPVVDGEHVKLRARNGNFLRANRGLPPWRNSVTHDFPHRSSTRDWVLWEVHVIEFLNPADAHHRKLATPEIQQLSTRQVAHSDSFSSDSSFTSSTGKPIGFSSRQESSDSIVFHSPPRLGGNGRVIYYQIVDKDGNVKDGNGPLNFNGNSVDELTQTLEKNTDIQDIVVCTRSPLNGQLCPLRLQLPPNMLSMHVVLVPSASLDHSPICGNNKSILMGDGSKIS